MEKVLTAFAAFLLFGLLSYNSASANESSEPILKAKELCAERLKSGNSYEKVLAEDGTIVICAKGTEASDNKTAATDGEIYASVLPKNTTCNTGIQNIAEAMKSAGISNGYVVKTLIETFSLVLWQARQEKPHDYRVADILFAQIEEKLESVGWTGQDTGWYIIGDGETTFHSLAYVAREHWQRYGIKITNSLAKLSISTKQLDRYSHETIVYGLQRALEGPLFEATADDQKPTDADLKMLAALLLEYASTYPEQTSWSYTEGERKETLARIAPDVLAELKKIINEMKNK